VKRVLSSIGHIAIERRYYACRHCKGKQVPWESWAGVRGKHRVTPHAQRMFVLAGSGRSFDEAERNLKLGFCRCGGVRRRDSNDPAA